MVANHLHLPGVVGNFVWVPGIANLDGTGTLEFIAKVNLDVWTPGANQVWISKWTGSAGYLFFLESTSNDLKLMWRDSGPARIAQATVTPTAGGDGWLWVMAVATEDGVDRDVIFSTSIDTTDDPDAVTWTQLGAEVVVPFGAADLTTNTAVVFVGAQSATVATMAGSIAAARVNFNGVTELDIDFTDLTAAEVDAGSFTEDSGNAATVTIAGTAWAYVRPSQTITGVLFIRTPTFATGAGPLISDWYTVYRISDGTVVSTGTVIADPLPPGLTKKAIAGSPAQQRWDPLTLQWGPKPPPSAKIDRVDEFVIKLDAVVNPPPYVEVAIRDELDALLGDVRLRDPEDEDYGIARERL